MKHAVLVAHLQALCATSEPWLFVDGHAGRGLYELEPDGTQGEILRHGILRLLQVPPRSLKALLFGPFG